LSAIKNIKVYSIEPSADNFQKLLFNIRCNQAKNITAINAALSDKSSFGYLGAAVAGNSGTVQVDDAPGSEQSYLISLTTLVAILEYLQIKEIDLLKIDVEGFEMNVFNGFFPFTTIMPKNIIMEFSDYMGRTGYTMQDCYDYFIKLGYKPHDVNGDEYHLNQDLPEANLWWKLD
jgi:FkbM family methyltransferase